MELYPPEPREQHCFRADARTAVVMHHDRAPMSMCELECRARAAAVCPLWAALLGDPKRGLWRSVNFLRAFPGQSNPGLEAATLFQWLLKRTQLPLDRAEGFHVHKVQCRPISAIFLPLPHRWAPALVRWLHREVQLCTWCREIPRCDSPDCSVLAASCLLTVLQRRHLRKQLVVVSR